MQVKLLKEIVGSVAGNSAIGIVDLLYGKKNINEFLIAKKLNLNINQTRNILYKLADAGLVSFIRKKDKKNGGWYTYYWTLDTTKSLASLKNVIVNDINSLKGQLEMRQKERFYYCPNCDVEMNEENALLNQFSCPECGEVLVLRDPAELIGKIQISIDKRNGQLAIVDHELSAQHHKEDAIRTRRMKNEAKKKSEERKKKRALLAKTKAKVEKKAPKGKGKKK